MTIKAAYKYQLKEHIKVLLVFYLVLIILYSLTGIIVINSSGTTSISGIEFTTVIFLFVMGLVSFKEQYRMLIQNGVSRKSIFISHSLVAITTVAIMTVLDKVIFLLSKQLFSNNDGFFMMNLYEIFYGTPITNTTIQFLNSSIFSFLLYLSTIAIGYLITIIFYRLNKAGKVAVGAGVPVLLFIVYPIVDTTVFNFKISHALGSLFDFAFGLSSNNPFAAIVSFIILSIIISGFSWILIRKSVIKP